MCIRDRNLFPQKFLCTWIVRIKDRSPRSIVFFLLDRGVSHSILPGTSESLIVPYNPLCSFIGSWCFPFDASRNARVLRSSGDLIVPHAPLYSFVRSWRCPLDSSWNVRVPGSSGSLIVLHFPCVLLLDHGVSHSILVGTSESLDDPSLTGPSND